MEYPAIQEISSTTELPPSKGANPSVRVMLQEETRPGETKGNLGTSNTCTSGPEPHVPIDFCWKRSAILLQVLVVAEVNFVVVVVNVIAWVLFVICRDQPLGAQQSDAPFAPVAQFICGQRPYEQKQKRRILCRR